MLLLVFPPAVILFLTIGQEIRRKILLLPSGSFEWKDLSFSESTKHVQSSDYFLSLTQDSQSESGESVKLIEKSDLSHHWHDIWNNMLWIVPHRKDSSHELGLIYWVSSRMSVALYHPGFHLSLLIFSFFYLKNEQCIPYGCHHKPLSIWSHFHL